MGKRERERESVGVWEGERIEILTNFLAEKFAFKSH